MKNIYFIFLLSVVSVQLVLAQGSTHIKVKNSLSGVVVLTAEGGTTIEQTDYRDIKPDFIGKASIEYFLNSNSKGIFGIKIFGAKGYIGAKSTYLVPAELRTAFHLVGAGLAFTYDVNDIVYPYISFGLAHMWFYPRDNNNTNFSPMAKLITVKGDIGFRFMVSNNFSVNLMGGLMTGFKNGNEDDIDGQIRGKHNDWVGTATLGLSYYIGKGKDTDGDGVDDSKDMCPDTPVGVQVDEFGCPLDSDNDGIADYLDKCPNTPAGVKVDANGCPLDSDNDGVVDYLDKCPGTPAGLKVDSDGCPLDSDNDGVADYLDKCPNTPAGAKVDANGCPLDSDHDGVPDYLDKCPNTPRGREVDANGCTVKKVVNVQVMSTETLFEFDQSTLKPGALDKLNIIIENLKQNKDYTLRIEGYTDSKGSDNYNLKLGEKRARTVSNYIISQGINKKRIEVVSFGEANPIASNETEAGRAANRRVEIKIKQQ